MRRLFSFLSRVAEEMRQLGTTRYFYYSLAVSSLILVLQILAFWLVMEAYGLHLSLWAGSAVLLILHLGTPLSPMRLPMSAPINFSRGRAYLFGR